MSFHAKLQTGKTGESQIARWLMGRGMNILPIYEIADNQYKGPAVFTSDGAEVIAPDLLVFGKGQVIWVEAKYKQNAFTWHRLTQRWVTGIDIHHYNEYQRINRLGDWPVWLLLLHCPGVAKDSPEGGPTGLYGNSLDYLIRHENHRHENWGNQGMVYWSEQSLKKMSDWPL